MNEVKILEGPGKEALLDLFGKRLAVPFKVTVGKTSKPFSCVINEISHEDGSGHKFIMVGMKKEKIFYDPEIQKGSIRSNGD